ncbi:MAG TPA: glycosyltransferase [Candidatus Angelobacter sp.]|nr:glycosyltransferase [Candidatus Angelobacter sp.]
MVQAIQQPPKQLNLATARPRVRGKFLFLGEEKFWVRGVSYGTFLVDDGGQEHLMPDVVERDFAQMVKNGFNVVRVHTCPPRWFLDTAMKMGLRVMVGLNWGERISFSDEPGRQRKIEDLIRKWVRSCAGHPAVFCYVVGNEISSSIARWSGRHRVEGFIRRLYRAAKEEDPDALVTYANYPSTEYLRLPFLDFLCFNVYLESRQAFENYIARLHSLSEDRPVLISEIGLDNIRNGEEKQAQTLDWQVRTTFKLGCCGVVIFAWTDEWYHGKYLVEDWKFGLTTYDRTPRLALRTVRTAFLESPFPPSDMSWPKISVIVCSFNGASTIHDTLKGLQGLDYPDYEVIVVNDGSTDSTAEIVSRYPVRLISTANQGLSEARNTGIKASTGEIIAFIDDDAYPDIHWLRFLALSLTNPKLVGTGGPNLPPDNDGWKAEAIANAPGPNAVLLTDSVAEHIPGCNMAFRRTALQKIGEFDPRFRVAGDDVDLCWRLQEQGGIIGFAPAAVVWHHRRNSIRKYWKQQRGYGRAEALLERKWPEKYNSLGQTKWLGRIYGKGVTIDVSGFAGRIYQGVWGSAPFQSLYGRSSSIWSLTLMPEWYLIIGLLALMFILTIGWVPMVIFGTLLTMALALPIPQAALNTSGARLSNSGSRWQTLRSRTTVLILHLLQPVARLVGRLEGGLTPWRRHGGRGTLRILPLKMKIWCDQWEAPEMVLGEMLERLRKAGAIVRTGGIYDSWDLEVQGGLFGGSRLLLATEDHPPRKQLQRYRVFPVFSITSLLISIPFAAISVLAGVFGAWVQSIASGLVVGIVLSNAIIDASLASGIFEKLLKEMGAA